MKPQNTIAGMVRTLRQRGARFRDVNGNIRTWHPAPGWPYGRCPLAELLDVNGGIPRPARDYGFTTWRIWAIIAGADMQRDAHSYRTRRMLETLVKP